MECSRQERNETVLGILINYNQLQKSLLWTNKKTLAAGRDKARKSRQKKKGVNTSVKYSIEQVPSLSHPLLRSYRGLGWSSTAITQFIWRRSYGSRLVLHIILFQKHDKRIASKLTYRTLHNYYYSNGPTALSKKLAILFTVGNHTRGASFKMRLGVWA